MGFASIPAFAAPNVAALMRPPSITSSIGIGGGSSLPPGMRGIPSLDPLPRAGRSSRSCRGRSAHDRVDPWSGFLHPRAVDLRALGERNADSLRLFGHFVLFGDDARASRVSASSVTRTSAIFRRLSSARAYLTEREEELSTTATMKVVVLPQDELDQLIGHLCEPSAGRSIGMSVPRSRSATLAHVGAPLLRATTTSATELPLPALRAEHDQFKASSRLTRRATCRRASSGRGTRRHLEQTRLLAVGWLVCVAG